MADESYSAETSLPEREDGEAAAPGASDAKIVDEARSRWTLHEEAEGENRRLAKEDLEFLSGDQWPADLRKSREADGRPCLTVNKLPQSLNQITNDQRQNRASIKVHPVDDKGDPETAKIYQGLLRHIEYDSNADSAYNTGFECAARGGFGFWRVVTQFVSPTSFDQEIKIKRIRNAFSVRLDPFSQEPDGSDANWGFIAEDLSKDDYCRLYPKSKLGQAGGWDLEEEDPEGWKSASGCRVVEYFTREWRADKLVRLSNGETALVSKLSKTLPQGVSVVGEPRDTQVPVIRWYKMNGFEILDRTDWLGQYIPIIPTYGQELDIAGKRILESITRHAKDPAKMYNYWASAETEAIALAPRAPFIAAAGQIEGYEEYWETANKRNHSYLPYKPIDVAGTPVPPPQRQAFEPAVQAITQARMMASDDLKATTGVYDATLGARSNETSGVAIQKRNTQAQTSNFHLIDNLRLSQRHTGRVIVDLIPHIYDTARAARIIGDEGNHEIRMLNAEGAEINPIGPDGKPRSYMMGVGKYDVTLDTGPSFATKRQEAASSMLEVTKAMPQIMGVAGDLLVKNMDWPGAQELSDRLKKTLPPGLADEQDGKKQPIPPQVQAQMQQMSQMVEQLTAKLNEAEDQIRTKRIEIESRERIEMAKLDTQTTIELAKLDAKDSIILLQSQISQIEGRMRLLGASQPIPDITEDQSQGPSLDQPADGAMGAAPAHAEPMPHGGLTPDHQPMEPV